MDYTSSEVAMTVTGGTRGPSADRRGDLRDFVLLRTFEIGEASSHETDPALGGLEWAEEVGLEIGTHRGLPSEQRVACCAPPQHLVGAIGHCCEFAPL